MGISAEGEQTRSHLIGRLPHFLERRARLAHSVIPGTAEVTMRLAQEEVRSRVVNRGTASLDERPRRERSGHPSGMIRRRLVESAALADARRRAVHRHE